MHSEILHSVGRCLAGDGGGRHSVASRLSPFAPDFKLNSRHFRIQFKLVWSWSKFTLDRMPHNVIHPSCEPGLVSYILMPGHTQRTRLTHTHVHDMMSYDTRTQPHRTNTQTRSHTHTRHTCVWNNVLWHSHQSTHRTYAHMVTRVINMLPCWLIPLSVVQK